MYHITTTTSLQSSQRFSNLTSSHHTYDSSNKTCGHATFSATHGDLTRWHTDTDWHAWLAACGHAVTSRDGIAVNHRECDTTCNGDRATALKQKISLSRRLSMPFPVKSCGKSGLSTAITNMVKKEPHSHQNLTVYILCLNSRVGLAKVIFAILELHIWLCCPYAWL